MIRKRKFVIALFLLGAVLLPNFSYNLWPQEVPYGWLSNRFMDGTFDLSRQVLPPAYHELEQWLNQRIGTGDIFRIFWLPLDPAVLSTLEFTYPNTPVFFPQFEERNFTQTTFDYMSNAPTLGWNSGLGKMLAVANVKYIVVNLSANDGGGIWEQRGPPSLTPWGPSYDLRYYFTGDPLAYKQLLDREQGLNLVRQGQDFVVYENLDFVPYFSAYRSAYMVLPNMALDQETRDFKVYNYSNSLIQNGGFEKGVVSWGLQGNWSLSSTSYFGNYSLLGSNSAVEGWIEARQDVSLAPNTNYVLSAWMKTQNVKQSHLRLTFYDSNNKPVSSTYPQSGTDGSRNWWHVIGAGVSPLNTSYVSILLMGGWSLDKQNPAQTWFDDISFLKGYYPDPSPTRSWAYPIMLASSEGNLLSDIPTIGGRTLILSGEGLTPSTFNNQTITQLSQTINGLILLGDADRNSTLLSLIERFPRLLFMYEPGSALQPETGQWLHLIAPAAGTPEDVAVIGQGQGRQDFFVPRDSNYTIAIRAPTNGNIRLEIDNSTISLDSFRDSSGRSTAWIQSTPTLLHYGEHRMRIDTNSSLTILDKIVMLSSTHGGFGLQDIAPGASPSISFDEKSSTGYELSLDSSGPAYILFGENYDSSWSANQGQTQLTHVAVPFHMYWSNMFAHAGSGLATIEVLFSRQESRNILIAIWETGWLLSLIFLGVWYRGGIVKQVRKLRLPSSS